MKRLLPLILLMAIAPAMPAKASPDVSACFNSLLQNPEYGPKSAEIVATVDHEGSQYHEIVATYERRRANSTATMFVRTDADGGCERLLAFQEGSSPEYSVYEQRLGPVVAEKLQLIYEQRQKSLK